MLPEAESLRWESGETGTGASLTVPVMFRRGSSGPGSFLVLLAGAVDVERAKLGDHAALKASPEK